MVLWGKQAHDDDCDGTLLSQKKVDADTVVWLQVVFFLKHILQVCTTSKAVTLKMSGSLFRSL